MEAKPSWLKITFVFIILLSCLFSSVPEIQNFEDRVRVYTRSEEYDYSGWTLDAWAVKLGQASTDAVSYMAVDQQKLLVMDYLTLARQLDQIQGQISLIYSDPTIKQPETFAKDLLLQQAQLNSKREILGALAETVIQEQVSEIIDELGLSFLGQPLPPVLYHVSALPMHLIISPRDVIREDSSIPLQADLDLKTITAIEAKVEKNLNVSALVVPVGGISNYPTMVMSSSDLEWLIEVVGHEWMHNNLGLQPLGLNYDSSPEMRTMNETTADIAGTEISRAVLAKYYPELLPSPASSSSNSTQQESGNPPEEFDFNKEMHLTRVNVDKMLAAGNIDEAEQYMEMRRQVFWEHGYMIRRLNQAYFAFYGAYAESPIGPAGADPVGPAVTQLRAQSPSLAVFIRTISKMTSFQQLEATLNQSN